VRNVAALFDDDLHYLSLQVPLAVGFWPGTSRHSADLILPSHVRRPLGSAGSVMISRNGFITGERGPRFFLQANMAVP